MSYTRRFTKEIEVYYSGSESYPASEHGGTIYYDGSKTETIVFEVEVDTDPFDAEVDSMKKHVDLLTGSVVATEAAHVAVIDETSRQVGDTIISGFFKTVKSEISQQIAELKSRSQALLIQLNKLAQRVRDKKQQMGVDYQRLAERYGKIFSDLNNELENRIYSIDEPVFKSVRSLDSSGSRNSNDGMVSTVSVSSGENARVHSMLAANLAKRQAVNAIEKGHRFLQIQHATDRLLGRALYQGGEGAMLKTPFCLIETTAPDGTSRREVYSSPLLEGVDKASLENKIGQTVSRQLSDSDARAITDYFNSDVATQMSNAQSSHDRRVAELTARLFDISATVTPGR